MGTRGQLYDIRLRISTNSILVYHKTIQSIPIQIDNDWSMGKHGSLLSSPSRTAYGKHVFARMTTSGNEDYLTASAIAKQMLSTSDLEYSPTILKRPSLG